MVELDKNTDNTNEDAISTPLRRGLKTIEVDEELMFDIEELIHEKVAPALLNILTDLHPADIAEIINHLKEVDDREYIFNLLDVTTAGEVLLELDLGIRQGLLQTLSQERISLLVGQLESDDAADIIAELSDKMADTVLRGMPAEDSAEVQELLRYPEDTAGGIMATEVVTVNVHDTVHQAMDKVREAAKEIDDINVLYAVDDASILCGTLTLKDLITNSPRQRIQKSMSADIISVNVMTDQEEVANIMQKYDLISIPVVNDKNQLVGRITIDDVVDVIKEEATEDIEKMAGITGTETSSSSVLRIMRLRLPWLLMAFVGELLSAVVLSEFQASLEKIIVAAFFIPIVMAMGGNAGIQSSAIVVRGLATGEIWYGQIKQRLIKEFGIAISNGLILSSLLTLVSSVWFGDFWFGFAIGVALLIVVINATVVGAMMPFILNKIKIDPAVSTGPFITTTNDALGLLIYFMSLTVIYLR
ncbi:MAG: magnesium transporter [Bacteroidetes bacterium]|nr:magnesium transporter [Bacteroidota bacterium]MBU1422060.1 magnesium transporter [Bacteroidota bacterium]MBU2471890.1 magnesium transporter [Bacteroidota bacterium]MBU2636391.1 magnesium transporter [Bacteroidota bacterium]